MAIYHNHISIISRGKNHSAVGKIAYNHCAKLVNETDGVVYDYTKKHNSQGYEFFRNGDCPFASGEELVQHIEKFEKSNDAQLVREEEVSIPVEYMEKDGTISEFGKDLVRQHVAEVCRKHGILCADISFHSPPVREVVDGKRVLKKDANGNLVYQNPHAHIVYPMREWDAENQTWKTKSQKQYLWCDGKGNEVYSAEYPDDDTDVYEMWAKAQKSRSKTKAEVPLPKWQKAVNEKGNVRSRRVEISGWDKKEFVHSVREMWAKNVNEHLKKNGIREVVDHRSLEVQGEEVIPQIHLSKQDYHDMQMGKRNPRIDMYIAIRDANAEFWNSRKDWMLTHGELDFETFFKPFLNQTLPEPQIEQKAEEVDKSIVEEPKVENKANESVSEVFPKVVEVESEELTKARKDYKWLKKRETRVVEIDVRLEELDDEIADVENAMGETFFAPKEYRELRMELANEDTSLKKEKKGIFREISQRFKTKIDDLDGIRTLLRKIKKRIHRLSCEPVTEEPIQRISDTVYSKAEFEEYDRQVRASLEEKKLPEWMRTSEEDGKRTSHVRNSTLNAENQAKKGKGKESIVDKPKAFILPIKTHKKNAPSAPKGGGDAR